MGKLITHNSNALRFLMNEDIYKFNEAVQARRLPVIREEPVKTEEIPEPVAEVLTEELPASSFNYLGENNRYFLILVDDLRHRELNTAHKGDVNENHVCKEAGT